MRYVYQLLEGPVSTVCVPENHGQDSFPSEAILLHAPDLSTAQFHNELLSQRNHIHFILHPSERATIANILSLPTQALTVVITNN